MRGLAGVMARASPLRVSDHIAISYSLRLIPASPSRHCFKPSSIRSFHSRKSGFAPIHASLQDNSSANSENSSIAPVDLDPELYSVLILASDEELETIYSDLYGTSLLSPLGKSIQTATPPAVHYSGRDALIRRIDRRFRFLAADSEATLKGQWPSYRQALLAIQSRLNVPCPPTLATQDLEAEIFLHLISEHAEAVDATTNSPSGGPSSAAAEDHAGDGDGMTPPPGSARGQSNSTSRPNIFQKVIVPLKLGAKEVLPTLTRLGATLAVTNIHLNIARQLGSALAQRSVQYEAANHLASVAGSVSSRAAVRAAQRGLTAAASRYGAARSVLSVIGPVLWALTAIDLARMSIGCDYARIVRAVFTLAQIRLLRTDGWVTKSQYDL